MKKTSIMFSTPILFIFIALMILISCTNKKEALTVEETVRQCKVCEDNGYFAVIHYDSWNSKYVVSVTCESQRSKTVVEYSKSFKDTTKKSDTLERY